MHLEKWRAIVRKARRQGGICQTVLDRVKCQSDRIVMPDRACPGLDPGIRHPEKPEGL
ncbi:MAG: hypothetical protein ACYSSJ_08860 [Planctomycetota bacterium]